MGGEVLLYGYGAVCLSMLVYNVVSSVVMKKQEMRLDKRCKAFGARVAIQLDHIQEGKKVEQSHIRFLSRKLCRIKNLAAFDRVMESCMEEDGSYAGEEYKKQIQPVFLHLALVYSNRETMQSAYFAYFLSRNRPRRQSSVDVLEDVLVQYMKKQNLYCRVNALDALCGFGSEESIVSALSLLSREGGFIHEKILADSLLTFTGNHERLMELLWNNYEGFSAKMQLAVLNYIRFKSGRYCNGMLRIMMDSGRDKEQRLLAIRYFGKYFYEPAMEPLLAFASDENPLNWEYTAVSVSSLAKYAGKKVADVLMGAVHSSNWYVRYNAVESLETHEPYDWDLTEAAGGSDRYAREMLMYRLEIRNAKRDKREGGK